MKKTIRLLPAMLLPLAMCLVWSCRQKAEPLRRDVQTAIEWRDTFHRFEIIPLSSPVDSFDFSFVNRSTGYIVILGAKVSCRCTDIKYNMQPVAPGDSSYVRIIYDGRGRGREYFRKSVSVYTNASDNPQELTIEGRVAECP